MRRLLGSLSPFRSQVVSTGFVGFHCVVAEDRSQTLRFERHLVPHKSWVVPNNKINTSRDLYYVSSFLRRVGDGSSEWFFFLIVSSLDLCQHHQVKFGGRCAG